jgi:hypothetical protein
MDEIHIDFQWKRDEYLRVSRKGPLGRAGRRLKFNAAVMIVAGISLFYVWNIGVAWFIVGLGALYLLLSYWFLVGVPNKAWKSGIDVREPMSMLINEDGVTTKGRSSESKLSWDFFPYSREWPDYYFLLRNRRGVPIAIPKRGFKSQKDEAQLRALLESRTQAMLTPNGQLDSIW